MSKFVLPPQPSIREKIQRPQYPDDSLQLLIDLAAGDRLRPFRSIGETSVNDFLEIIDQIGPENFDEKEVLVGINTGRQKAIEAIRVEVSDQFTYKLKSTGQVVIHEEGAPNNVRVRKIDESEQQPYFSFFTSLRNANAEIGAPDDPIDTAENLIARHLHVTLEKLNDCLVRISRDPSVRRVVGLEERISAPAFLGHALLPEIVSLMETVTGFLRRYIENPVNVLADIAAHDEDYNSLVRQVFEEASHRALATLYNEQLEEKRIAKREEKIARAARLAARTTITQPEDLTELPDDHTASEKQGVIDEYARISERLTRKINSLWQNGTVESESVDVNYLGKRIIIVYDYDPVLKPIAVSAREKSPVKKDKMQPHDAIVFASARKAISGNLDNGGDSVISMGVRSETYKSIPLRYSGKRTGQRIFYTVTPAASVLAEYNPAKDLNVMCIVVVAEGHSKKDETTILEHIRGRGRASINSSRRAGIG